MAHAAAPHRTRLRMLDCGRRIVARGGLRGLTVRGVAAQAKVNLGTFVYHFGTREQFIAELIEDWYAPIYAQLLDVTVDEAAPALEKMRRFLLRLGAFLAENRRFVRHLLIDAASNERAAARFVKSMLGRHPLLLLRLIREAQQAGELRAGDPMAMGMFLFGATLLPSLWLGVLLPQLMPKRWPSDAAPPLADFIFVPAQIEQRFEWALQGLLPQRRATNNKGMKEQAMNSKSRTLTSQARS